MRTFFALLLLVALAIGGWLAWALRMPLQPEGQKFVLLRPGYSTWRIASELKSAQVIRSANAFVLWHYFHHKHSLKAGEYLFDRSATAINVHDRVARGDIYVHTLVIPEGYTIFDIAQAVQDAGLGSKQEFLQLCTADITLVSDIAPNAKSLEGYLFPATYEFTRTESMHDMLAAMVKQFREVAASIGLNANVQEMVIMASIIEKETAVSEERPLVASVYYNRLARNIALQADPSVIYAELLAGTYRGALHHEDLQVKSAYNTYRYPGLPPGPIGNPGKTSLQAAMQPASTDYYYFVSDGNGHHRFANSLEEHNRNVVKLRQVTSKR
ncbi:MAG: endolytic transglycosylase MltG [Acidobacteria bacterium]|nr:MAG: endolytic transglycosylase MltG [Acidobacteriota bacterium]